MDLYKYTLVGPQNIIHGLSGLAANVVGGCVLYGDCGYVVIAGPHVITRK